MASGAQHFRNNSKLSLILLGLYFIYLYFYVQIYDDNVIANSCYLIFGVICGILITPDIDVAGKTYTEFLIQYYTDKLYHKSLGYILKNTYFIIVYPFEFFLVHRSFFSHFPIVGTLIKFGYFLMLYGIVTLHKPSILTMNNLLLFIPWAILDIQHFIDDGGMYIGLDGQKKYFFGTRFYEKVRRKNNAV